MGYFQQLKNFDAFKLPVTFFFNRRNKKSDKKVFARQLGSIYGFTLTVMLICFIGVYFLHLFFEGIVHGRLNSYNSYSLDNDFRGFY